MFWIVQLFIINGDFIRSNERFGLNLFIVFLTILILSSMA